MQPTRAHTPPDPSVPVPVPTGEHNEPLDHRLFLIVGMILALLSVLFVAGLWTVRDTYNRGLQKALVESPVHHEAVLAYARGLDAAFVKTSALFLGFLLVFTGALYVLRIATSHYRLSVKSGHNSGNLQTSSPGLVIITLGILLIIVTMLTHSVLDYTPPSAKDAGTAVSDDELSTKPPPSAEQK
jgi:hypothetical protein